jgi:hypothetical protein
VLLVGPRNRLRSAIDSQLSEDVFDVIRHCFGRQDKAGGNFALSEAFR